MTIIKMKKKWSEAYGCWEDNQRTNYCLSVMCKNNSAAAFLLRCVVEALTRSKNSHWKEGEEERYCIDSTSLYQSETEVNASSLKAVRDEGRPFHTSVLQICITIEFYPFILLTGCSSSTPNFAMLPFPPLILHFMLLTHSRWLFS